MLRHKIQPKAVSWNMQLIEKQTVPPSIKTENSETGPMRKANKRVRKSDLSELGRKWNKTAYKMADF